MKGYGESDKPQQESDYRLSVLSSDIKEIIFKLGYSNCILVSHDWGGLVAYMTAYNHPQVVEKLIVLTIPPPETSQFLNSEKLNWAQMRKSYYILLIQLPWLFELTISAKGFKVMEKVFVGKGGIRNENYKLTPAETQIYKASLGSKEALFSTLAYYRNLLPYFYGQRKYPSLQIPTLLIGGEHDQYLDKSSLEAKNHTIQNLKLVILSTSHWINQDAVEETNKEIQIFLG